MSNWNNLYYNKRPNINKKPKKPNSKLEQVFENQNRFAKWQNDAANIISSFANSENVLKKQFVAAHVAGKFYTVHSDEASYSSSELCFVKFSFGNGITDKLTLFPDPLNVPIGFRENLYEDLGEAIGWRPDTYRNNHSFAYCTVKINEFFRGIYDPLFVLDKYQFDEMSMSLYHIYDAIGKECPWIHSLEDRGKYCTIYCLDILTAEIINKGRNEKLATNEVRAQCEQMNQNIASEICERHEDHGLPNQCAQARVIKNLYSTLLLVYSIYKNEMSPIEKLLSKDYFSSLDYIIGDHPLENDVDKYRMPHYWSTNSFEDAKIEHVVNAFGSLSVRESVCRPIAQDKGIYGGRGRLLPKKELTKDAPGTKPCGRKWKLPRVAC